MLFCVLIFEKEKNTKLASTGKKKSCLSEAIVRISSISNYSIMECHKGVNFPAQFVVRIQHSPTCWIQLLLSLLVQVSLDFLQAGFISERILIDGGLNLPATNGSTLKIDIPKRKIYFATMHFQVLLLLDLGRGPHFKLAVLLAFLDCTHCSWSKVLEKTNTLEVGSW